MSSRIVRTWSGGMTPSTIAYPSSSRPASTPSTSAAVRTTMTLRCGAVRVATLNLFNNPHGRWADRESLVLAQARALDADVYAFQEVAARSGQLERLLDGLGAEYVGVSLDNPDPEGIKSLALVT